MADKRYIKFSGDNGYCGSDYEEYQSFDKDTTDETINQFSEKLAYENAGNFAIMQHPPACVFRVRGRRERIL